MAKEARQRPQGGGRPMIGAGEKAENFSQSMRRILRDVFAYRWSFVIVIVTGVISTLFNIVGPKQLGRATTEMFEGILRKIQQTGDINFDKVGEILIWVAILYVVSSVFAVIQNYAMTYITQHLTYQLREKMMNKLNRMPMAYFEARPYGEVLSRFTNDIDTLGNGLNQSITTMITSVLSMIGILWMMVSISWQMTLIALLILPLSMLILNQLMSFSQKYFKAQQSSLGVINGQVEETFSGHMIVKAFNQEGNTLELFSKENERLKESAWKSQFISGLMFPLMEFVSQLGYIGVVISGAYFALNKVITVGDIQAFTQYINRFTQPMTQIAQVVTMMQSMAAAGERIYEFLDETEEDQSVINQLDSTTVHVKVTLEQVSNSYDKQQPIIRNFSAEISQGQKVALVGHTGAGKSTIVKLLMRFYDVDNGRILLDGKDIREYQRESFRESIAMVLQDTWLFNGSIMDNIRYGKLNATDEEVYQAAKQARADHFIQTLPGTYDFVINEEGNNISQGQKQLLTIARAILADRPLLILDEATSSVDTRTEYLIQEAMANLMKDRTSFVIAHRLSTIKDADVILYMENGDIVEQGDHDTLMALNSKYADLYLSQFHHQ